MSAGNFPTIGRVLLNRVKPTDSKMSFSYDKFVCFCLDEAQICVLLRRRQ